MLRRRPQQMAKVAGHTAGGADAGCVRVWSDYGSRLGIFRDVRIQRIWSGPEGAAVSQDNYPQTRQILGYRRQVIRR